MVRSWRRVMARNPSRRTAIVADRRPLERGLARFLLEERGLFVVGEAATMADVLLQVQQLKPDLVVLHEKLALDHDPTVIAQIRRISPADEHRAARGEPGVARAGAAPPGRHRGGGWSGPHGARGRDRGGPSSATEAASEPASRIAAADAAPVVSAGPCATGSRWADRLQGLAVASIIALAFVVARRRDDARSPTVEDRCTSCGAWHRSTISSRRSRLRPPRRSRRSPRR